jgi:MYXO-CTERM domain-containing protein
VTEFPANGATAGNAGLTTGTASTFIYCSGNTLLTTMNPLPAKVSSDTTGDFTFTNTENPVTYECKLDSGTWASCAASYTTPTLTDGSHTLSVRATDVAGTVEDPAVAYTWTVATLRTTIHTDQTNPTTETTGSFTFTNTQSPVTYECKLDSGTWASCGASYTTPALADGSHTLSVRATLAVADASALVEDPPVTYTWVINTGRPITTISTNLTNPTAETTGSFTFTNTQSPVTYECKLDSGAWASCTASYTTPVLDDGTHTLSVRATMAAVDAAPIVEDPPATYTWVIKTGRPVTTIKTYPNNPSNDTTGDFTFTNTQSPVTYECKLDSGAWASCGASYTTPVLADGEHTLSVRATVPATDASAIVETPPVTYTWVIDTIAPDTSIQPNPSDPTKFTFGSNESPVTYECKLDSGNWVSCKASYTTPDLADGTHTLSVRATDTAGNVDATPATYTWTIPAGNAVLDGGVVDAGQSEARAPIDGGIDSVRADRTPDVQGSIVEPGADAASVVALDAAVVKEDAAPGNPDTAVANADVAIVVKPDAASQVKDDAATAEKIPQLLGGGFCSIASSRTTSPSGFMLLALAGLALLRRRRR